jgi:hypothetical protein
MVIRSFLLFQGSRPGLFYDLSVGDFCPLRIPPINRGLRLPPLISREKDSGLRLGRAFRPRALGREARRGPPVTSEKTSCPSRYCKLFNALSSIS